MGYSRNFGFRDFTAITRHGRLRAPTEAVDDAGARNGEMLIGTAVVLDPDNPGFVTRPDAAQAPDTGCGIVVYEHIQWIGTDPLLTTSLDFDTVPSGQYVQVVRGPSVKIWLANTADKTFYDGRTRAGYDLVAGLGTATPTIAVGDYLTVTADGTFTEGDADTGWLFVEQVDGAVADCRFTF